VHLPEHRVGELGDVLHDLQVDHQRRAALSARASELGETHRRGALAELIEDVAIERSA
jgi:hypothetical protein